MEHKKAYDFLYKKCKDEGHIELANHIKQVGPLKLQVSNKTFITHLSKIIVGQQVSVAAARAIWNRTKTILKQNKYKNLFEIFEIVKYSNNEIRYSLIFKSLI